KASRCSRINGGGSGRREGAATSGPSRRSSGLAHGPFLALDGDRPAPGGRRITHMQRSAELPTEDGAPPSPLLDRWRRMARAMGATLASRPLLVGAATHWAPEIFWVQEQTLRAGYSSEFGPLRLLAERCVRFAFDLSFTFGLLALLPRALLALPLVAWQILAATLLGYHAYFDRALSWQTIAAQMQEGL